jgi:outer membrane lipopolysaccharide assembly protein LptE/RlpB
MKKLSMVLMLLLSACAYHLVGQGDGRGIIPANAEQVVVMVVGRDDGGLKDAFTQVFKQSFDIPVAHDDKVDKDAVEVRLESVSEALIATAFDTSGIAKQYRLSISASARVLQSGKEIWVMQNMAVSADVFATGGSAEIEAQKVSVAKSLREEWSRKAVARLRSGF